MIRYSSYEVQMKRYLAGCCFANKMQCYWEAKEDGDFELADSLMESAMEIYTLMEALDGWRQIIETGITKTYTVTITGGSFPFPFFSGELLLNGYNVIGPNPIYIHSGSNSDVIYGLVQSVNSNVSSNDNNSSVSVSYNGVDTIVFTVRSETSIDFYSEGFFTGTLTTNVEVSEEESITGVSYQCLTNEDVHSVITALEKACGCSLNSVSDFTSAFEESYGEAVGPVANCSPAYLLVNGSSLGDTGFIHSGGGLNLSVTQDGSPVGSWNGSEFIIPPCAVDTLTIAFQDSGGASVTDEDFNGSVTIIATVNNFTPTEYQFTLPVGINKSRTVTIGSNSLAWNLKETFGEVEVKVYAKDGSGNEAFGTATFTVNYIFDRSISADGVTAFAGMDGGFDIQQFQGASVDNGNAMSVDFWFKYNGGASPNTPLMSTGGTRLDTYGYGYIDVDVQDGYLRTAICRNKDTGRSFQNYNPACPINDGNWHHLALSREDISGQAYLKVWFDGVEILDVNTSNGTMYVPWNAGFITRIFASYDSRRLDGEVADFAMRDRVLTLSEVEARYNGGNGHWPQKDGLVTYWKVLREVGTVDGYLQDLTGNGNWIYLTNFTAPDGIISASLS